MITHHWEPRYKVGDILYVRETFYESPAFGTMYRADWRDDACPYMEPDDKWRPSIHMPKEAARLFLRVTGVRVERLQDMKDEDAYNEGWRGPWCAHKVFENYPDSPIPCYASDGSECPPDPPCNHSIPELFGMDIWDNTIKKADLPRYGWATNPWVWVIAFERISKEEAQKGGEE